MFLTKATIGTLLLLAVGVVGGGEVALANHQITPSAVEAPQGAQDPRGEAEPPAPAQAGTADKPETGAAKSGNALWKEQAVLKTPGWLPGSVAYSSNGTMLVIGGTGGNVVAFDAVTRKERWRAEVGGDFAAVAFTADGTSVLATFTDGVRFLEAATEKLGDSLERRRADHGGGADLCQVRGQDRRAGM